MNKTIICKSCAKICRNFISAVDSFLWNAVRDSITFFPFVRHCMKFNTFFAFIKLFFLKAILTSYNVSVMRLLHIPHKTLPRPSFKAHAS